ncbi:MAG: membrane protein insertase YidC [Bacteroidaceae bacterium]|nr:membrane protein insertase YidC [Bacteroidaceae bacterium]
MDKNTITGLVLIGILLVVFSYLSRPTAEQREAQQRYYDSLTQVQQHEEELKAKQEAALANERQASVIDSTATFFSATQGANQQVTISNDILQLTLNTKGGSLYSAVLNDYMEQDKVTPVTLFRGDDVQMNYLFYNTREAIQTKDYYFSPVNRSDSTVTMRLSAGADSYIDFNYALHQGSYLVDFTIQAHGMQGNLAQGNKSVDIEWNQRARQIEKGYTYENRLAQLTFMDMDRDIHEMNAARDDEKQPEETLNWVAFKNQFFSAIFISDAGFQKSRLNSKMEQRDSGYIKHYSAEMNTAFDPTGAEATQMYFYFGPNHYKILGATGSEMGKSWKLNRLVYLGWPLVRWVNQFFTINVFDWLLKLGLGMGWVLLIMTLIVKAVVYPATYKTYMSSAKMRVLKPKVDEINAKYPKEEDNMKKQQEVMQLYSQYRVSPMGGCLPMLIQFPILMALFFFVPSAIELRQQSFLWADDLSTYDAIVNLPFNIPFLGSHISLFCLLMTVTNTIYTMYSMKMQDTGANPQLSAMKWMSIIMPIMFFFILNDYPSGLNYYYFLSTLITVIIMTVLKKTTNEQKLLAQLEANKKTQKEMATGGGFAARLQAMQEQQEALRRQQQQRKK